MGFTLPLIPSHQGRGDPDKSSFLLAGAMRIELAIFPYVDAGRSNQDQSIVITSIFFIVDYIDIIEHSVFLGL